MAQTKDLSMAETLEQMLRLVATSRLRAYLAGFPLIVYPRWLLRPGWPSEEGMEHTIRRRLGVINTGHLRPRRVR